MAYILIVHSDRSARNSLESHGSRHHRTCGVASIAEAAGVIAQGHPDLILVGLDAKKKEALELLRRLKNTRADIPTLVVGGSGAGAFEPMAMKLGAAGFLEYPVNQKEFDLAVSRALQGDKDAHGTIPPICDEELESNLSDVERNLNRRMRCFAGKNQVYIQSYIQGYNRTTKPRISLKCPLRREYGDPPNVYYEYIRDVCCGDPTACPAYQKFRAKNTA